MDKQKRNQIAILSTLNELSGPVSSSRLCKVLAAAGHELAERTVRLYLAEADRSGLTTRHSRKGRTLTPRGLDEIRAAQTLERVGYLSAKIDQMTYRMGFDLQRRSGTVVVNTSMVDPQALWERVDDVCQVFAKGYGMGTLLSVLRPGEHLGDWGVPPGKVGFCTVCSVTLNGVLLKHGVPTSSRFGGLLDLQNGRATHFVEMIHYDGTSIDPLEVFIRSGMTDYYGAIRTGNGRIGASFREMPADSRELVLHLADQLDMIGLGALMEIGLPGQPLLDVPVSANRIGAIVIGGLNPIAILEEDNKRVSSRALAGLMEFNQLYTYESLRDHLKQAM
jgi:HTH-type transcriptional regulator, global nitrogen regulator NrpRI